MNYYRLQTLKQAQDYGTLQRENISSCQKATENHAKITEKMLYNTLLREDTSPLV